MSTSKRILVIIVCACVVSVLALPHPTSAQFRWWRDYDDDGYDFDEDRRRRSDLSDAIDDLDDDEVDDLPIPVLFGVMLNNLYPNFGDPRDGGAREHEGFDIIAPEGTPIVSPTEAVVTRTGRGDSSGNFVYTANPGGESFIYYHLSEIADDLERGDELDVGDLIGFVGDTGNAEGGLAHLHLEIREGREPEDAFLRITEEFDLEEKMEFLDRAFDVTDDEDELIEFLLDTFSDVFADARRQGIELPDALEEHIEDLIGEALETLESAAGNFDMTLGSQGEGVEALQLFLIGENTGPASVALQVAGATSSFGPLTQDALAEYQRVHGISPASGYYGPLTRSYIQTRDEREALIAELEALLEDLLEQLEEALAEQAAQQ